MDAVVLDTDVVSFLFKDDTRAELYRPHLTDKLLVISFMTLAELDGGCSRGTGEKRGERRWSNTCVSSSSILLSAIYVASGQK